MPDRNIGADCIIQIDQAIRLLLKYCNLNAVAVLYTYLSEFLGKNSVAGPPDLLHHTARINRRNFEIGRVK